MASELNSLRRFEITIQSTGNNEQDYAAFRNECRQIAEESFGKKLDGAVLEKHRVLAAVPRPDQRGTVIALDNGTVIETSASVEDLYA